jgi:hypothetical protein
MKGIGSRGSRRRPMLGIGCVLVHSPHRLRAGSACPQSIASAGPDLYRPASRSHASATQTPQRPPFRLTARRSFVDRPIRRPSLAATAEKRAYFPFRVNSEFLFLFDAGKRARRSSRHRGTPPAYLHASILIQERCRCKPPDARAGHAILGESDIEIDMPTQTDRGGRPTRGRGERQVRHLFFLNRGQLSDERCRSQRFIRIETVDFSAHPMQMLSCRAPGSSRCHASAGIGHSRKTFVRARSRD